MLSSLRSWQTLFIKEVKLSKFLHKHKLDFVYLHLPHDYLLDIDDYLGLKNYLATQP